jgi:hypothetical protein
MRWQQLVTALRDRVAPSLRDRIRLHQARYRYTREEVGRVWLTVDGREIVQFDTSTYLRRRSELAAEFRAATPPQPSSDRPSEPLKSLDADEAAAEILRRAGKYDDYGALADLEAYLSLPIEEALASPSPLVRALAVIDRRVGKRRLRALAPMKAEHPLVRELYELRCDAEGITFQPGASRSSPRASARSHRRTRS